MEAAEKPEETSVAENSDATSSSKDTESETIAETVHNLNGDDDIVAEPKDAPVAVVDKVVLGTEAQSAKPSKPKDDGGLLILDISKQIAKTESDNSEEDDIFNDFNRNKGRKRRASDDKDEFDKEKDMVPEKIPKLNTSTGEEAPVNKGEAFISDLDLNITKESLGKGKRARIPNKRYSDIIMSPNNRGKSFENGAERTETDESTAPKDDIPVSPPLPKKKLMVDVTNPAFQKPFNFGWKRELVWRAFSEGNNKVIGDVYYYTPAGKKIRSLRELRECIAKSKDLTMDNFTFAKETLGVNDPEKEILRDAKKPSAFAKKVLSKNKSASSSPKTASPKTKGEMLDGKSKASPRSSLGNFKIKAPSKGGKSDKKGKQDAKPDERMDIDPPSKSSSARKSGKWSNKDTNKPCQPCSIRCEGVQGIVPTLQCRICLCLYHHHCVGYSPHNTAPYVCKNCNLEDQTVVDTGQDSVVNSPPPLTPIDALKSSVSTGQSSAQPPKLQRIPRTSDNTNDDVVTDFPPDPEMPRLTPRPIIPVPVDLPPPPPLENSIQRSSEEPTEAPRPQYLEILGGRKFLVIPKHNFMSVSPTVAATASRKSTETNANTLELVESNNVPTDSASLGPNADAKINPESPSKPENSQTNDGAAGVIDGSQGEEERNETESPAEYPSKFAKRIMKPNITTAIESKEDSQFMANYLQNVSYGYLTLLYVFQYLKVQDLLRAGCVCTMWRDIANHSLLWRTVRMKNSQVHSFEGFANTLKKHGTVHLDLRKMLLPAGVDEIIWPQFSEAIEKVDTLRKIELCRCPSAVVEKLASTNPELEVLNAVTIKCETMCIDPLVGLKNIKELRLKSTMGLNLTSDIHSLQELKTLTHLSLTSVRKLNTMNLSVIAELTKLESLDLGECSDFPEDFGETILFKLKNLEKLRLEKGQGNCHTFEILEAVKSMRKLEQLELVNFDIKSGFDKALGACTNIKKLLIIPTYISQSATTNHMVLGGVLRLQKSLSHFVWGVTLELLRVTELFVDQCEEPDKKEKKEKKKVGNGDSIPVLKPVPLITDKDLEIPPAQEPPQVEILPLPNLQKLLLGSLPNTRVKILKIPFHATWRQSITDSVN